MNFPMGKEGFQRARRNAEPMASVHEGLLARWEIEPKTGVLQKQSDDRQIEALSR
jgi:hypothetical protein